MHLAEDMVTEVFEGYRADFEVFFLYCCNVSIFVATIKKMLLYAYYKRKKNGLVRDETYS